MLKSIFSILVLFVSLFGAAQEVKKTDSVKPKTERYGIRFGIDVAKLARTFYDKDYKGLEFVGDYKLTRKHYFAAEIGNENKTVDEPQLNFTSKGTYLKAGFDYNAYENWAGMQNMIYVGLRYGFSTFSQTLNTYQVYNANPYFGEEPTKISGEKFSGLTAQWAEVVVGVKAEVYTNLYVGFSLRVNRLFANTEPNNFENLYIPGFNKTSGGNYGAGFNYTVSYFLPLYKSTVKAKEVVKKK